MSLEMVSPAVPDFVASAWLVATTCAVAKAGISTGAVYTPSGAIVPIAVFPPTTPFTLHVTKVSFVFATVAVKVCALPRTTTAFVGDIVTAMDGGGGGGEGATEPAPPPPQPSVHAPAVKSASNRHFPKVVFAGFTCAAVVTRSVACLAAAGLLPISCE